MRYHQNNQKGQNTWLVFWGTVYSVMGTIIILYRCCSCHHLATYNVTRAIVLLHLVLQLLPLCHMWCWGCHCYARWVLQLLLLCCTGCCRCYYYAMFSLAFVTLCMVSQALSLKCMVLWSQLSCCMWCHSYCYHTVWYCSCSGYYYAIWCHSYGYCHHILMATSPSCH